MNCVVLYLLLIIAFQGCGGCLVLGDLTKTIELPCDHGTVHQDKDKR